MKKFFILLCLYFIAVSGAETPSDYPSCGSKNSMVPVIYGMPDAETIKQAKPQKIICGGCCVLPEKKGLYRV